MYTLFLFCAVIAGTVFLFQFVMLLVGFGAESADFDVDVPDTDMDFDAPDADALGGHGVVDHGSVLFEMISLRTIVAAVLFFGLGGMITLSTGQDSWLAIIVGLLAGAGAMYGVHLVMSSIYRLREDGGLRIRNAIGQTARVYVPVPGDRSGTGKVQVRMQGRLAEISAVTKHAEKLPTGTQVKVVGIVSGSTVEVKPIHEKAETAKA